MTSDRAWSIEDRRWMEQACALATLVEAGQTSPNPRVGCLLVRGTAVVGRGVHLAPGRPHAEAIALSEAGSASRGSTLYVNLEPCSHHGRTPPCVDLLLRHGVRRVVASLRDPNPLVDGSGFARLREAGVEVEVGLLASWARGLNEPFLHWHERGLPLVTLKAAASLDGRLSAARGCSRWITGPAARRFAHRLRLAHDAVLVGAETVRRDDPLLTARLDGSGHPALRAILSRSLDLDPRSRIFRDAARGAPRARVYTSAAAPASLRERLSSCADIVEVPERGADLDLRGVLHDLGRTGVQSLLVEGGGATWRGFLDAGLAHRAALFYSSELIGDEGATPLLGGPALEQPGFGWRLERRRVLPLGEDFVLWGRLRAAQRTREPCEAENRCSPA